MRASARLIAATTSSGIRLGITAAALKTLLLGDVCLTSAHHLRRRLRQRAAAEHRGGAFVRCMRMLDRILGTSSSDSYGCAFLFFSSRVKTRSRVAANAFFSFEP